MLELLKGMGLSEKQATTSLLANNNAVDRAVEWLFGQGEGLDVAVDKVLAGLCESHRKRPELRPLCRTPIIKDGQYILFNDRKVAMSQNPPTDLGFLYLYRRTS